MIDEGAEADRFTVPETGAWRALAEKALRGADFEAALVRQTRDGVARGPLMTSAEAPTAWPAPGAAPFVRGPEAARDPYNPWDKRARIMTADPKTANAEALDALVGGAASLELVIDPHGAHGVAVRTLADFKALIGDVKLDLAPIGIEAGGFAPHIAAMLRAVWDEHGHAPDAVRADLNMDPLGALASQIDLGRDLDVALDDAAQWAFTLGAEHTSVTVFRADARPVFDAGGTYAQSIGWAAACATAYLRVLLNEGLPGPVAARQIAIALSVDADVHQAIAAQRALRQVWARITEVACGAPEPARIHADPARRALSQDDPWTNILRIAASSFAAAVGGADVITASAIHADERTATRFSRRVGRNILHLASDESGLGRVADPAGGSFHHEAMTAAIAEAAWVVFQHIERAGGAAAFLASGGLAALVAPAREALERDAATRAEPIVGVTHFPAATLERTLEADTPAPPAHIPIEPSADRVNRLAPTLVTHAVTTGGDVRSMIPPRPSTPEPTNPAPLQPLRLAAPYEALRRDLAGLRVTVATLGPLRDHAARATWARNLLAVAGLSAESDDAGALAADGASADLFIVCASDAGLAEEGAARIAALSGRGAVWVAGRPNPDLAAAGVARFVHEGVDILEALSALRHLTTGPAHV